MRRTCLALILAAASVTVVFAQNKPIPQGPAVVGPPIWTRAIKMPDGRTLVSDGALAVDAAIAKPASLPTVVLPVESGTILERQMNAAPTDEVALISLGSGTMKNTFLGPRGIHLNGNHVTFLRRVAPQSRLRFRGPLDAIVIMLNGKPIGLTMAVSTARPENAGK
jgi:hypothetical protein